MKPKTIIIGLRIMSWILLPVIFIGIYLAIDKSLNEEDFNFIFMAIVVCMFIYFPTALLFLCAGMIHLLEGFLKNEAEEQLTQTQFQHCEPLIVDNPKRGSLTGVTNDS